MRNSFCFSQLLILSTAATCNPSYAQSDNPKSETPGAAAKDKKHLKTAKEKAEPPQAVVVSGRRLSDVEQEEASSAAKSIIGREELDKYGDSNVLEVLKRVPGITLGGQTGRPGNPRLRGLGGGLTQILVNGTAPPPGFNLENLEPESVERIEIVRGAVAEFSTQGVAGTINIVLKESYRQKDIQLRLSDSLEKGRHSPSIFVSAPKTVGNATVGLTGSLNTMRRNNQFLVDAFDTIPETDQQTPIEYTSRSQGNYDMKSFSLAPTLNYRYTPEHQFNFGASMGAGNSDSASNGRYSSAGGQGSESAGRSGSKNAYAMVYGTWTHNQKNGRKLHASFRANGGRHSYDALFISRSIATPMVTEYRFGGAESRYEVISSGKLTTPLGSGHAIALGWDGAFGHTNQERSTLTNGVQQYDAESANVSADTRRLALFAQDEWQITGAWSANAGLRWEAMQTTSPGAAGRIDNDSSVLSPIMHGMYKFPGAQRRQLRLSYARTYRAASVNDLIAAPYTSPNNRPTSPDRTGNPLLKPELADGVDLGYEHYLSASEMFSGAVFVRQIDGMVRRETASYDTKDGPRWINIPVNGKSTRVRGIELNARVILPNRFPGAPDADVRFNVSRHWTDGASVYSPTVGANDNVGSYSANAGVDYRMKALPLTLGGSFNYVPAGSVQSTPIEFISSGVKRQFDLYALYKLSKQTRVRIAGNNLFARDSEAGTMIMERTSSRRTVTYATWSLRLEMTL